MNIDGTNATEVVLRIAEYMGAYKNFTKDLLDGQ